LGLGEAGSASSSFSGSPLAARSGFAGGVGILSTALLGSAGFADAPFSRRASSDVSTGLMAPGASARFCSGAVLAAGAAGFSALTKAERLCSTDALFFPRK
jgi:hypothetical protein